MSVNFNIALLRSLKEPLMDSLSKLHEQLQEILDGKRDPRAFEASEAHLVVGSLSMINARGARVIAETIETLMQALQNPADARFQSLADQHQGMRTAQQGIKALEMYLSDLINGAEDQPVKLWSPWSRMVQALGDREPQPDALYFPAPMFDDESFHAIQANDLKMRVESARRRFDEGATQWANADGAVGAEAGLRQVLAVVGELYDLRHRKGFQSYWLGLSARVQAALLHPQQERDDKRPLGALLDQASVELRKFAEDQKKVSDDTLRAVVLPLVNVRTLDWAKHHPVFADLDRRFGIREFLRAAQMSADTEGQARLEHFVQRQQEIKDNLNVIKTEWAKHIGVAADKRNLIKGLTVLLQKRDVFPGEASPHLLGALAQVSEHYAARMNDKVSDLAGSEVATLLVMTEAVVDRRGQVSDEFAQQCELQKRRVQAALADRNEDLAALPHASWDHQTRNEQARQAMRHVVQEVKKDLAQIEKILDDVLREREDSLERLSDVPQHAKVALGALRIMNQATAARVLEAVCDTASRFAQKGHVPTQEEREHVTVGLGSLTMFLGAYESGDVRASRMLAPALKTLFNENLPVEDDASDMIVPSTAPVDHAVTPDLSDEADEGDTAIPVIPAHFEPPIELPPAQDEPVEPVRAPAGVSDWARPPQDTEQPVVEHGAPQVAERSTELPVDPATQPGWDESSDAMIAEVFLEEAMEALDTVAVELTTLQQTPTDHDALTTVRRQFHTLKGSGRMAQFYRLGMVAWWIEERLNEVLETGAPLTPELLHTVDAAAQAIRNWIVDLTADQQRPDRHEDDSLRVWVDGSPIKALLEHEHPVVTHHADIGPVHTHDTEEEVLAPTDDAHEEPAPAIEPVVTDAQPMLPGEDVRIGSVTVPLRLFDLFSVDAQEHADLLAGEVAAWYLENDGWTVSEAFLRSAHTLRSLGRTVGLPALAELGGALETRADQAHHAREILSVDTVDVLEDAVKALRDMIGGILKHHEEPVVDPDLLERLRAITPSDAHGSDATPESLASEPPMPEAPAIAADQDFNEEEHPEHPAPVGESVAPAHVTEVPVGVEAPVVEGTAVPVPLETQEPVAPVEPVAHHAPEAPSHDRQDIAAPHDPWDDALDALGVIAHQVQRLTVAFEAIAKSRQ